MTQTHTMEGDIHSKDDAGIVPRSVNAILEQLEASGSEFTIRVSFLELYNEELQDLLNTTGEKKLKLCEDVKKGVVCQNLEEIAVLNASDVLDILQRGIQQRQTAATLCNKNSSRSHSIFTMKIMIKEYNVEGEEVVRHGQLNLVDLAGSECIGRSGAKNDRAREAGSINQSLLTLGRVITALVDHHQHIPYRDSKLTRLLQESLGGKAKTCIIATFSPSQSAVEETMSTLDYAHRAKNIKNQPTVNQKLTKKVIMKEYFAEIETLRSQLMATREKNGVYMDPAEFYAMESRLQAQESQLNEAEAALRIRNDEVRTLKLENTNLESKLYDRDQELLTTRAMLEDAKNELIKARVEVSSAYKEWQAAEGVVSEQAETEQGLFLEAQRLHGNVQDHARDVAGLLGKVSRLHDQEQQRVVYSQQFASSMLNGGRDLSGRVKRLASAAASDANTLSSGVSTLLARGKDTCASLNAALSEALQVLVGDSAVARDQMLTSCKTLGDALQRDSSVVQAQVTTLQDAMDSWLIAAQASAVHAETVLKAQVQRLQALEQEITTHQGRLQTETNSFVVQQEQLSSALLVGIEGWRQESVNMVSEYAAEAKAAREQQHIVVQQAAKETEEMVTQLMQKLVTSSQHSSRTQEQAFSSYVDKQNQVNASKSSDLTILAGEQMKNDLKHFQSSSNEHSSVLITSMQAGTTDMCSTHDQLANQHHEEEVAIGNKRKLLTGKCSEMSDAMEASTKRSRTEVEQVANTADVALEGVRTAAEKMNGTAANAVAGFTDFMEEEGMTLQTQMNAHFDRSVSEYEEQIKCLDSMVNASSAHDQKVQGLAAPITGSTPTKLARFASPVFARTREHTVIRKETKSSVAMREVTYEHAANALSNVDNAAAVENEQEADNTAFRSIDMMMMMDNRNSEVMKPVTVTVAPADVATEEMEMDVENLPPKPVNSIASRLPSRSNSSKLALPSTVSTRSRPTSAMM